MDKLTHLSFVLLLAVASPTQDLPLSPALERAIAADELEHDLARAKELLRVVAEDAGQSDGVRRHAWLRLARLQRRAGEEAGDALARAAVGEDAVAVVAREMQAQGKADPAREAELQAKAEAAVERAIQTGDFQEALWFGDAAVPVAIRKFEERLQPLRTVERDLAGLGPLGQVLAAQAQQRQRSAAVLWYLPGDRAQGFLRDGLQSAEVGRRQAVAAGIQLSPELTAARLELARLALRDPDEEVVASALAAGSRMSAADLLPLCLDARNELRRLAILALLRGVQVRFEGMPQTPELRAESEAIAAALPGLLATTSLEEHRRVLGVVALSALYSRAGRTSLLANLSALRDPQSPPVRVPRSAITDWGGNAENAAVLREALVRRGPYPRGGSDASVEFARALANTYVESCWDRSALDAVLATWRLGYCQCSSSWLQKHATDEDAGAVVAGLAGSEALRLAVPWLSQRDLPEVAFGPLRDALQPSPNWDDRPHVLAIGRTGHRDAAAFVRGLVYPRADYAPVVLQALSWIASKRADAESIAALRAQVAASLPITDASPRDDIAAAVGTLVRLGDMEIIGMFDALAEAFAYLRTYGGVVQGQQARVDTSSMPGAGAFRNPLTLSSPLSWLIIGRGQDTPGMWHGYSPEQYRAIWRRVLAPTAGKLSAAWQAARGALAPLPEAAGADPLLVEVFLEATQARLGEAEETPVAGVLTELFEALELGTVPDSLRTRVRDLREAAFTAPAEDVRAAAMESLAAPFDAIDRAHLLRGLADASSRVNRASLRPFEAKLLPLDREVLEHAFRSPHAGSRQQAFPLLRRIRDDVPDILRGLLADPDVEVRYGACIELAHSLRLDAVPALLEALKDPTQRVREAATQALQSIRFYHDEKAHWDRAFAGRAGLTATSAAEALLEQAKPVNDAPTRVLAIRSLGVLGAPETQPFLIEWTKDANAEVAAAAREAVGRIHARK